jgi:hypothetical protein
MASAKIPRSIMRYCPILNPNNAERFGTIANGLSIGAKVTADVPYWSEDWQSNICKVKSIRGKNAHYIKYQNLQFEEDCWRGSRKSCIDCKKSCPTHAENIIEKSGLL